MLCLGTVSSLSIFRKPLESELGLGATASLLPFTVALVCFAAVMPLASRWISRGHGQRVAIAGSGVGLAYGVPLAVGLTVTGFGLSPLITAPLAEQLISGLGTRPTLRLFGLVFLAILLLRQAPTAAASPSTAAPAPSAPPLSQRSRSFTGLWLSYGIGALVGTTITGQLRDWFGSYTAGFGLLAGLAALGILLAGTLLPGGRRQAQGGVPGRGRQQAKQRAAGTEAAGTEVSIRQNRPTEVQPSRADSNTRRNLKTTRRHQSFSRFRASAISRLCMQPGMRCTTKR